LEEAREALWNQRIQAYQERVAALERPLVEELLAAGLQVVYASPDAPLLLARLPKDALLRLAQHPAVAQIWDVRVMEEEIDTVKRTSEPRRSGPKGPTGGGSRSA